MYDLTLKHKKMTLSVVDLTKKRDAKLYALIKLAIPVLYAHLTKVEKISSTAQVEFSLMLCGNAKMKKINNEFRKKNRPTDVLSFPLNDDLRLKKKKLKLPTPVIFLGDVIICKDIAIKQAKEFEITYEQESMHLLVHGFLHLIGYDHERSLREEILMEKLEIQNTHKILKRMKNGRKN